MADASDKPRPFYVTKRFWGAITALAGGLLTMTPGAPVAIVIGTLPVTWPMIGVAITNIGGAVFGYGLGMKVEREKETKTP
jgi:hypothetical protein